MKIFGLKNAILILRHVLTIKFGALSKRQVFQAKLQLFSRPKFFNWVPGVEPKGVREPEEEDAEGDERRAVAEGVVNLGADS